MTLNIATAELPGRRLTCAACGTDFGCDLSGQCWCMEEAFTLSMPTDGGDCLCPACLRNKAEAIDRSPPERGGHAETLTSRDRSTRAD